MSISTNKLSLINIYSTKMKGYRDRPIGSSTPVTFSLIFFLLMEFLAWLGFSFVVGSAAAFILGFWTLWTF